MYGTARLPMILIIGVVIAVEIGIVVLVLFILQKSGVKVTGGLTKTAWRQGMLNAFFMLLIIMALLGVVALVSAVGFGQSIKSGIYISIIVLWFAAYFYFFFNWFTSKQKAGQILLDVIPFPTRVLSLISAGFFIIAGLSGFFSFAWRGTKYSWGVSAIIGLSIGAYNFIMAFSRVRIHENGLYIYVDLIRWNRIEAFEWVFDEGKAYTLKIRYKGGIPTFLRNGAIPIPIEKKEAVDSLLKQYVPGFENNIAKESSF